MKRFSTILKYLSDQKGYVALYFIFNLLSVLFSLVSLTMLVPFLQLLVRKRESCRITCPRLTFSASSVLDYIKYILECHDPGAWHLPMRWEPFVSSSSFPFFLKIFFSICPYRILGPMRNRVLNRLRADLYSKILDLPLGFFTEQRKGDLISRMSNDINEIEWSVISTLEGVFREPLTILVILVTLVFLSPPLSLFLFVLLPLTGFIIGRVSRSLKKQSNIAQEQLGTLMSILDETLGGLRVIKAFNAENLLRSKFFQNKQLPESC